ncbi:hypothetical protein CM19_02315 [Candidatus Acidianus copahuensis]|uniref:Uncharacterized protein n=1 Tax=Candidatus Acidianus copahuensis TaxID=1160895 RepID=A0A031LTN2_9CREN|nr:hypothetical protein CM19_02315 [Candidatus Acidianus copahuensis]
MKAKTIAAILFISTLILELYFYHIGDILETGMRQINNINLSSPNMRLFVRGSTLIISINNTDNFPVIIYNITGKYNYLPQKEVIPPNSIENISAIVTNATYLVSNIRSNNYSICIELGIFNTNISIKQVI